ncbi:MAG: hypothetical protein AAFU79_36620, partial [Myxococcota bacterium]
SRSGQGGIKLKRVSVVAGGNRRIDLIAEAIIDGDVHDYVTGQIPAGDYIAQSHRVSDGILTLSNQRFSVLPGAESFVVESQGVGPYTVGIPTAAAEEGWLLIDVSNEKGLWVFTGKVPLEGLRGCAGLKSRRGFLTVRRPQPPIGSRSLSTLLRLPYDLSKGPDAEWVD